MTKYWKLSTKALLCLGRYGAICLCPWAEDELLALSA